MKNNFKMAGLLILFSGCANVPQMYQDFNAHEKVKYTSVSDAFKSVHSTGNLVFNESTTVELGENDPVLLIDSVTHNKGYFKIYSFTPPTNGPYSIKAFLNCRCFGKFSGKNAVCPKLYLLDPTTGKTVSSPNRLTQETGWTDHRNYVGIDATLEKKRYQLLVAADNRFKGQELESAPLGTSSILSISIGAAPDGQIDLIFEKKK